MSDLFRNHIVGFPTGRLICMFLYNLELTETDESLAKAGIKGVILAYRLEVHL